MREYTALLVMVGFVVTPLLSASERSDEDVLFPMVDDEIVFEQVVEVQKEASSERIFSAVRAWSASSGDIFYRKLGGSVSVSSMLSGVKVSDTMATLESNYRAANPLIYETPPESIAFKVVQHFQAKQTRSCVRTLFVQSTLRIDVKDGKYRYRLGGFTFNHWNHFVGEQQPIWTSKSVADNCGVSGTLEQLQECPKCEKWLTAALVAIAEDVADLLAELQKEVAGELIGARDDDW